MCVFAVRWSNCLPFSGNMPVIDDLDSLSAWGIYLMYAQEPLNFPLGLVESLGYPFGGENQLLTRGASPLFAIILKLISKLYPPASEFYYLVLIELLGVFATAYFASRILGLFRKPSFSSCLLVSVISSLSFPMLKWSISEVPSITTHFPLYTAFGYAFIRLFRSPGRATTTWMMVLFFLAAWSDSYILLALGLGFTVCCGVQGLASALSRDRSELRRSLLLARCLVLSAVVSYGALASLGPSGNLMVPSKSPMTNRYGTGWGYGGGVGGGFHVSDVLALFIPPEYDASVPRWKPCGPTSYLVAVGWPLTTLTLQDGQNTGFAYVGTVCLGLLSFLMYNRISNSRRSRLDFRAVTGVYWRGILNGGLHRPQMLLFLASFALFALSWGYIAHVGGIRMNGLMTPALALTAAWPKFVFARALGRFSFSLVLFVTIGSAIWVIPHLIKFSRLPRGRALVPIGFLVASLVHVSEISGYLVPPSSVSGNDIVNSLTDEEQTRLRQILAAKRALIVVPSIRDDVEWGKLCYAVALTAGIPMNGSPVGLGVPPRFRQRFNIDRKDAASGEFRRLLERNGDVAILIRPDLASPAGPADLESDVYELADNRGTVITFPGMTSRPSQK